MSNDMLNQDKQKTTNSSSNNKIARTDNSKSEEKQQWENRETNYIANLSKKGIVKLNSFFNLKNYRTKVSKKWTKEKIYIDFLKDCFFSLHYLFNREKWSVYKNK